MKLGRMTLIVIISVIIVGGLVLGATYAWYTMNESGSEVEITTSDAETLFSETENISFGPALPIPDNLASTKAAKATFSVAAASTVTTYGEYTVSLDEISMGSALKNSAFKYSLLKNGKEIASGNFASIGSSTTLDIANVELKPAADNLELRIWISETNGNQNDMMSQTFKCKIKITTYLNSDTLGPEFSGDSIIYIPQNSGESYNTKTGITISDNYYGVNSETDFTASPEVIDTTAPIGTEYIVTYTASDLKGNTSTEVKKLIISSP